MLVLRKNFKIRRFIPVYSLSNNRNMTRGSHNSFDGVFYSQKNPFIMELKKDIVTERDEYSATSFSPQVIKSMITAALEKKDIETFDLLIEEAFKSNKMSCTQFGSIIQSFIERKDFDSALLIIVTTSKKDVHVSSNICELLLTSLVNSCKWEQASILSLLMIDWNYSFRDREMFFIIGGLMSDSNAGVVRTLELMTLIATKQRDDLAGFFSFSKVLLLRVIIYFISL